MTAKMTIDRLIQTVEEFRQVKADIQTETIHVFLLISNRPGITSKELIDYTGMSQSSVSRHLAILSEWSWKGQTGLDLVENLEDPMDRRTKRSYLKFKGRALVTKIARILDPELDPKPEEFPLSKDMIKRGAR